MAKMSEETKVKEIIEKQLERAVMVLAVIIFYLSFFTTVILGSFLIKTFNINSDSSLVTMFYGISVILSFVFASLSYGFFFKRPIKKIKERFESKVYALKSVIKDIKQGYFY